MKPIAFLSLLLLLSGCGTGGAMQKVLNSTLPPEFTGALMVHHQNPYGRVTIEGDGLRRAPGGWVWEWLVYERTGFFNSTGVIWSGKVPENRKPPLR